jgi:hypothetical protein
VVTRETEFSIEIEKLRIKFKGTQEVGLQIQQGVTQAIGGLMNAQARVLAAQPQDGEVIEAVIPNGLPVQANGHSNQAVAEGTSEKLKQPRQRRSKGGPSIANLLLGLKEEGFFTLARTSADVLVHLKDNKGHTLPENSVRTELQRMVQKEDADPAKLHRTKNDSEKKLYIYKDSPFNESNGSPSSGELPAQ